MVALYYVALMDSATQAALGASVAYAFWGKTMGRRALVLGAVLGTLPDLDVLAYPWLDEVVRLSWHRGISHSVAAAAFAALVVGWVLFRLNRKSLSFPRAVHGVFWVWWTHALIDGFNTYGTLLFWPFSETRVQWGNLFVIDPVFSIPLLAGAVLAWLWDAEGMAARRVNLLGLGVAAVVVFWSFLAQERARVRFQQAFPASLGQIQEMYVLATPFNSIAWRALIRNKRGQIIEGTLSLLRRDVAPVFSAPMEVPLLPEGLSDSAPWQALERFSNGWLVGFRNTGEDEVMVCDLRFGRLTPTSQEMTADDGIFRWTLRSVDSHWILEKVPIEWSRVRNPFGNLLRLIVWGSES